MPRLQEKQRQAGRNAVSLHQSLHAFFDQSLTDMATQVDKGEFKTMKKKEEVQAKLEALGVAHKYSEAARAAFKEQPLTIMKLIGQAMIFSAVPPTATGAAADAEGVEATTAGVGAPATPPTQTAKQTTAQHAVQPSPIAPGQANSAGQLLADNIPWNVWNDSDVQYAGILNGTQATDPDVIAKKRAYEEALKNAGNNGAQEKRAKNDHSIVQDALTLHSMIRGEDNDGELTLFSSTKLDTQKAVDIARMTGMTNKEALNFLAGLGFKMDNIKLPHVASEVPAERRFHAELDAIEKALRHARESDVKSFQELKQALGQLFDTSSVPLAACREIMNRASREIKQDHSIDWYSPTISSMISCIAANELLKQVNKGQTSASSSSSNNNNQTPKVSKPQGYQQMSTEAAQAFKELQREHPHTKRICRTSIEAATKCMKKCPFEHLTDNEYQRLATLEKDARKELRQRLERGGN